MTRTLTARLLFLALVSLAPLAHAQTRLKLALQPGQVEAMALGFAAPVPVEWIPVARLPAELESPPETQALLVAAFPGTLVQGIAAEGELLQAGAPVLRLASPAWAAALAEAQARAARSEAASRQSERSEALLDAGVISLREAEALRAEALALDAAVRGDRGLLAASLAADGSVLLSSPRAGRLLARMSGAGMAFEAGALLARIGDAAERIAHAQAPARLAGVILPGMQAQVGEASGEVVAVAAALDPESRSLAVTARVPAAAGLPGAPVELAVSRPAPAGTRRIPAAALIRVDGADVVFVRREGEIEGMVVGVAFRDGEAAWVTGLPDRVEVVFRGVLALKAVAEAQAADGEG
ncbi:efflux RND transporter periplasmic adaptor subunit [Aquimonas voraii]|uniref:Barrel-sandwich domain of CusB or HlyD membrane-fusion n=1 Tax=Aquimonas voraii TaxID=265719 RepID=A0A1G6XB26_9GAMM|nr:HlyD family efflux transporter periplasmic adaptor subunit [Aquimonas voraii]SDD75358.1 Barrel-sandwich domain of CusB or HlyD membrane-fusion [Aquimonas voraii]